MSGFAEVKSELKLPSPKYLLRQRGPRGSCAAEETCKWKRTAVPAASGCTMALACQSLVVDRSEWARRPWHEDDESELTYFTHSGRFITSWHGRKTSGGQAYHKPCPSMPVLFPLAAPTSPPLPLSLLRRCRWPRGPEDSCVVQRPTDRGER